MSENGTWRSQTSQSSSGRYQNPHEPLKWLIGLRNEHGKYLTAEPFTFVLNVSATTIKKRQIWTIVPDPQLENTYYFRSHLNRYLSSDKLGKVICSGDKPSLEERFTLEMCPQKTGRWAVKSIQHGYYLTGVEDQISCFSKTPVWWTSRLALHPQVHVKNLNRSRYMRLTETELSCDQPIPWTQDSLITLQFVEGKVAIRVRDGRYLHKDGLIVESPTDDALFNLELKSGPSSGLTFKDLDGKYLTHVGPTGTAKTRNQYVSRDELFILEDSYAQIVMIAHNRRYASIRQGIDLIANQNMWCGEPEIFQMEHQKTLEKWRFRTHTEHFWTLVSGTGGITSNGGFDDPNTLFDIQYRQPGKVSLKACNDSFLSAKKLGAIVAFSNAVKEDEMFSLIIVNRPIIVFRCEFGFVGVRNSRIECSFANYDAFYLELCDNGKYRIRDANNKYWKLGEHNHITLPSNTSADEFFLEFYSRTHAAILAPNMRYLRGEQNGTVKADSEVITPSCLWEY